MRLFRSITVLLATAAILAACSSPASSSGGGASQGTEPSQAAASADGGGGGGGSGGVGVALSDGPWTGGAAHIEYSGDKSGSFDAPLFAANSYTTSGQEVLTYIDNAAGMSAAFAIYSDSFAVSVTTAEWAGGGGTTTNCQVQYQQADEHQINATFNCPNSPVFLLSGTAGTMNISGTLSATR